MTDARFALAQLAEMTMLTERTLRTYLRRGLLQGEKPPTAAGASPGSRPLRSWAAPPCAGP